MKYDRIKVWTAFLSLKDHLTLLSTPKNQRLIEYILTIPYNTSEDLVIPDTDELSKATGVPRSKVLEIIRKLYPELIISVREKGCTISNATHYLWIHVPWEEIKEREKKSKENAEYLKSQSIIFKCNLPVMPRVGDEISLNFVDNELGFTHGYVYRIQHELFGNEQCINIFVHPFENIYWQWKRLEKDYNDEESRRRYYEAVRRDNG